MFLIDDILLAPIKSVIWLTKKINEVVEKELYDEGRMKKELMDLQLRLELNEISEEDYIKQEKELLARLDAATAKNTEKK